MEDPEFSCSDIPYPLYPSIEKLVSEFKGKSFPIKELSQPSFVGSHLVRADTNSLDSSFPTILDCWDPNREINVPPTSARAPKTLMEIKISKSENPFECLFMTLFDLEEEKCARPLIRIAGLQHNVSMKKNPTFSLLAIAVVLLLVFLWQNKKPETNEHAERLAKMKERMEANRRNQKNKLEERMRGDSERTKSTNSSQGGGAAYSENGNENSPKFKGSDPFSNQVLSDPSNVIERESVQHLQKFSSVAKLVVPPIPGIQFVPYDYDEGVEAVTGSDPDRGLQLTLFARAGTLTEQQFLDYIKNYPQGIPGLEGMFSLNLGDAQTIELSEGSGLTGVRYWTVQNGGKTVYLAMLPRKDGKGTYFASLVGSEELDRAEEFYYQTLTQIRATD